MTRRMIVIILCLGMGACDPRLPGGADLLVDFEDIDEPTTPLIPAGKTAMNGVYQVIEGTELFGDPVVGKWVGNRWCLYSQLDVVFAVCAGGSNGDSIRFRGYDRVVRSGAGNLVKLTIAGKNGASELIQGLRPASVRIVGSTDGGITLDLRRLHDLDTTRFDVLAHRGGGRNSDRLGISENSVEMIRFAPTLGATGVEVDVQRTRDNQLIIFHDATFSPRTVQGAYLLGNVGDFDLEQIQTLGKLINGEQIPTLRQALTAVINETPLTLVWLDIKEAATVPQVVQIQQEMLDSARARNRTELKILLGMPTQDVVDAYKPYAQSSDALCELEESTVLSLPRCLAWGPAWTRNITAADIQYMQGNGRRVFTWTVDLRESMVEYMDKGISGLLSNYPELVSAVHDSRQHP